MTIVLDCNIWITLIINDQLDFYGKIRNAGFEIATCTQLREEIIKVLSRPKLSRFIKSLAVDKVGEFHDQITTNYIVDEIIEVVTDLDDNYLFALCIKSNARFFVTGDKLLLKENPYKNTEIITLSLLKQTLEK